MYFSKKTKETIWLKYNKHCAYCGCELELKKMQVDHIIPQVNFVWVIQSKVYLPSFLTHLTIGDVNHIDNLNPSCKECNNYKNWLSLDEFREYLLKMINDEFYYLFKSKTKMQIAINLGSVILNKWDGIFYFEKTIKV